MDSASPSDQNPPASVQRPNPLGERRDATVACVKVTNPDSGSDTCIWRIEQFDLSSEFDGAEPGETRVIEFCMLTEAEIDALPEFEGW